ncbi:RNA methyltransferase [Paenibacillus psychroresistens]|uniref:RNA methyltransferase n=1 Tax=Paenibacillus psychroresistens TaxID=1778678 RepID=A0A6B8RPD4_9BACL|nr:RsmB/NOP family class I SAM-dependent RNA methyltransferase [Paenibacillus psychroresistens]QGQ97415.1 RNA methyltransferase [Paenibacillus psychroresistens]
MIKLPEAFIERMRDILGKAADDFLNSYNQPKTQGLRINTLKSAISDTITNPLKISFQIEPIPWCSTGFYYDETTSRPGKHPYHAAGLYYIQEPSAMSVVELLNPLPGDIVLDLAAAPGGKSTQIAGKMQGKGLLIANEIHPARAKILSENIERMGVTNAVVTSCNPEQLAVKFPVFFDKIMLDAPCSGEGMFRKDPDAIAEWSPDHVTMCAIRQMDILRQAVLMLKPNGQLAYSTCTFSAEENELIIAKIIAEFPQFELVRTERIWPHLDRGEGHFAAILHKKAEIQAHTNAQKRYFDNTEKRKNLPKVVSEAWSLFESFAEMHVPGLVLEQGEPLLFGDQLYWLPRVADCPFNANYLKGLKILRPGLHLGTIKKNRLEPTHSLALAISPEVITNSYDFSTTSPEILSYLHGEALHGDGRHNGWLLITIDGFALGWGKESNGQIKNHYPKGLRWLG